MIMIGARIIEHAARIRIQLPEARLFRAVTLRLARRPDERRCSDAPPSEQINPNARCTVSCGIPVGPASSAHPPRRRAMRRVVH